MKISRKIITNKTRNGMIIIYLSENPITHKTHKLIIKQRYIFDLFNAHLVG